MMPVQYSFSEAANRLFAMETSSETAKIPLLCINSNRRVTFHPASTFFTESGDAHPKLVFFAAGGIASHLMTNLRDLSPPSPGLELIMSSSANFACQLPPAYHAAEHAHQFLLVSAYYNAEGHKDALTSMARRALVQFPTSRTASLSTDIATNTIMFFATGDAAGRLISLLNSPTPTPLGIRPLISTSPDYPCMFPAAFHAPDAAHQFLFLSASHNAAGHLLALFDWKDRPRGPPGPLTVDRAHDSDASLIVDPGAFSATNRALVPRPGSTMAMNRVRIPYTSSTVDRAHVPYTSSTMDRAHVAHASSTMDHAQVPRASSIVDRVRGTHTPLPGNRGRASALLSRDDRARVLRASATSVRANRLLASLPNNPESEPPADATIHGSREPPVPSFTDIDAANQLVLLSRSDAAAGALVALSRSGSSNPDGAVSDLDDEEMKID